MKFTKMHGLGNDYVYVSLFEEEVSDPAALARRISDRHTGVGADGLILIGPSSVADARMRIFNADGSEAEMCGNGLRCVAKYVYEHGLAGSAGPFSLPGQKPCANASLAIETGRGVLTVGLQVEAQGRVGGICVDMGEPMLHPQDIPMAVEGDSSLDVPVETELGAVRIHGVSMGNPHGIVFVEDVGAIDLQAWGPLLERHRLFPQRANIHFVQVVDRGTLWIRTWERGSGVTLACGTGACACAVAAHLTGRADRRCCGRLPGGELLLEWSAENNHVYMTGPATEVFQGTWLLD